MAWLLTISPGLTSHAGSLEAPGVALLWSGACVPSMTLLNLVRAGRVVRKVPEVMESFRELAPPLLNDRHHGVLLSGVSLCLQICLLEPAAVPEYRIHVRPLHALPAGRLSAAADLGGALPARQTSARNPRCSGYRLAWPGFGASCQ